MATDPDTVTMNLSLPRPLKRYVDGKVSSGIYGSASEFVREAIREKLDREVRRQEGEAVLSAKLLEGLDSGRPIRFTADHFKRKKQALIERMRGESRRSSGGAGGKKRSKRA